MSKFNVFLAASVGAAVMVSAMAVIWNKHQSRTQFIELQRLQKERDRLDIEWGQLELEQSFSATPGRVEQVAYAQLKMLTPRPSDVRIVQANGQADAHTNDHAGAAIVAADHAP